MTYQWYELSKALADDSLPRRQSLRWLGAALAGAVLNPFGLRKAWAGKKQDPCEAFCNRCSTKTQRNQCINACRTCNGNTDRGLQRSMQQPKIQSQLRRLRQRLP